LTQCRGCFGTHPSRNGLLVTIDVSRETLARMHLLAGGSEQRMQDPDRPPKRRGYSRKAS